VLRIYAEAGSAEQVKALLAEGVSQAESHLNALEVA